MEKRKKVTSKSGQTEPTELLDIDAAVLSKVMSEMGRKGGKIGGKRRLETLSPSKRKHIARKAAQARWKKN